MLGVALVAKPNGITGREVPAATVLDAIEHLGHGGLGRKPFQMVEEILLQTHPRRSGPAPQHEVHLVGHTLDLDILWHGSILAPMEPIRSHTG